MGSYVPLTKTAEGLPQRDLDAIEAVVSQYPDMPVVVDEKRFRDVVMAPAPAGTTKRHDQLALLGIVLAWGLSLRGSDASKPHFFAALSHLHASISNGEAPSAEGVQAANLAAAYSSECPVRWRCCRAAAGPLPPLTCCCAMHHPRLSCAWQSAWSSTLPRLRAWWS